MYNLIFYSMILKFQNVIKTYNDNFKFSIYLSYLFGMASIKAFIHSIFPFWCKTITTDFVENIVELSKFTKNN